MKFLIDMNLSPRWRDVLIRHGWSALHWSDIGDPQATDRLIMDWARKRRYAIFTHDLDFGALLAFTNAEGPSVIQVRAQNIVPERLEALVTAALRQHQALIEMGSLLVINENTSRVRVLPLKR